MQGCELIEVTNYSTGTSTVHPPPFSWVFSLVCFLLELLVETKTQAKKPDDESITHGLKRHSRVDSKM
jgi:hypothetical protein